MEGLATRAAGAVALWQKKQSRQSGTCCGGAAGLPELPSCWQSTVASARDSAAEGATDPVVNCATRASNARNSPNACRVSRIIVRDL